MSSLHLISKSPASSLLQSCQAVLSEGDAILFIEDGIYHNGDAAIESIPSDIVISVLKEDCIARGIRNSKFDRIDVIDYEGFVKLSCDYDKVVSWF